MPNLIRRFGVQSILIALLVACGAGTKTDAPSTDLPKLAVKEEKAGLGHVVEAPIPTPNDPQDRQRREVLLTNQPHEAERRASEEEAYRLAKIAYQTACSELQANEKLKLAREYAALSEQNRQKGNITVADRIANSVKEKCQQIVTTYPGTLAARDAQDLLDGKTVPERATPSDPDALSTLPMLRLVSLERAVDLAVIGDWINEWQQIPAAVIDKGVLKNVPYQSFRAGDYEMNIYGDPEAPACLEIGVRPIATAATYAGAGLAGCFVIATDQMARLRCRAFAASLLKDAGDRCLLKSLNLSKDLKRRGNLNLEVTPETADDAFGSWWISLYDITALERARPTPKELERLTVSTGTDSSFSTTWSPVQQALARPGGKTVFVHSYYRKDGTYVHAHTRSPPGYGGHHRR